MKYPVDKCPRCGNDEFCIKEYASGPLRYNYKLDGTEADNSEMYSNLHYTRVGKYAYCNSCDKRLFKITEDMDL